MSVEGLSPLRTAIACGWNTALFTPIFLYWFRRLDTIFPGVGISAVVKKVVVNQLVITVPINGGFLAYTTAVEQLFAGGLPSRKNLVNFNFDLVRDRISLQIREDLIDIFKRSCMLWLPVNFLNFLLVPKTFRVLPTIAASTCWSVYLSLAAHQHGTIDNA